MEGASANAGNLPELPSVITAMQSSKLYGIFQLVMNLPHPLFARIPDRIRSLLPLRRNDQPDTKFFPGMRRLDGHS